LAPITYKKAMIVAQPMNTSQPRWANHTNHLRVTVCLRCLVFSTRLAASSYSFHSRPPKPSRLCITVRSIYFPTPEGRLKVTLPFESLSTRMTRLSEPGEKTLPPGQSWAQLFRKDARGGGEREQRRREWWSRKDAPVAQAAREVEALHASTASEMIWPPLGVADPSESSHSSSSRQERFLSESLLRGGERTSRFPQV
jgi:hypothetical protein